jgi:hypothetical protein
MGTKVFSKGLIHLVHEADCLITQNSSGSLSQGLILVAYHSCEVQTSSYVVNTRVSFPWGNISGTHDGMKGETEGWDRI